MPDSLTPESVAAARRDPALAILEGFHAVKHAIRFGAELTGLVTPNRTALLALAGELAPDVADVLSGASEIQAGVFGGMAPHPIPTPALAVARRPQFDVDEVFRVEGRIVLLDRPRHLGNIGAVVRVAAAAGAAAVLTTGDRDPWDPAALRGSAGLHFALPVGTIERLPAGGRPLVALHPEGDPLEAAQIPHDGVLAFGSERSGLDPTLLDEAGLLLAIPMRAGVSSLNLATSVAIVLYS